MYSRSHWSDSRYPGRREDYGYRYDEDEAEGWRRDEQRMYRGRKPDFRRGQRLKDIDIRKPRPLEERKRSIRHDVETSRNHDEHKRSKYKEKKDTRYSDDEERNPKKKVENVKENDRETAKKRKDLKVNGKEESTIKKRRMSPSIQDKPKKEKLVISKQSRSNDKDHKTPRKKEECPKSPKAPRKAGKIKEVAITDDEEEDVDKSISTDKTDEDGEVGEDESIADDERNTGKSMTNLEAEIQRLKETLKYKSNIITKLSSKSELRQKTIEQKDDLIAKVKKYQKIIDEKDKEIENLKDREFVTTKDDIKELKVKYESENIDLSNVIAKKEEEFEAESMKTEGLKKDVEKLSKEREELKAKNKSLKKQVEKVKKKYEVEIESKSRLLENLEEMTKQKDEQEGEKEVALNALEEREKNFKKAKEEMDSKLVELGIDKTTFDTESMSLLSETKSTVDKLNESIDMFEPTQHQAQTIIDKVSDDESGSDDDDSHHEENTEESITEPKGEEDGVKEIDKSNVFTHEKGNDVDSQSDGISGEEEEAEIEVEESDEHIEEDDEDKEVIEKVKDDIDDQNRSEYILPSDEEFEEENFNVGIFTVKNYSNEDISIAKNIKVPANIKNKLFQPASISINQKAVFVAVGTGSHEHSGGRQGCGLAPGCQITWGKGTRISKVAVLSGNHPEVGKEVWSCHHHSIASIAGYRLQMQMVTPKHRAGFRKERDVVLTKTKKKEEEHEVEHEVIDGIEPLHKNKLSRSKRNGGASTSKDLK